MRFEGNQGKPDGRRLRAAAIVARFANVLASDWFAIARHMSTNKQRDERGPSPDARAAAQRSRARPRRQNPRYPVRRNLELRLPDGSLEAYETRDVSAGGVFVAAATSPPLFSELSVLLRVRDELCAVPARVVHIVSPAKAQALKIVAGMGLQFEPTEPAHEHAIALLLREAQSRDPRRRVPRLVPGGDYSGLSDPMLGYVVAKVDGRSTPEEIAEQLELELEVTEALLRELARAGAIELLAPAAPEDVKVPSDRAAASPLPAERNAPKLDPVVRARLDALSGVLDDADHYAVLGVSSRAGRQEIFAAFVELSRVLHPDAHIARVNGDELAQLERTYARIAEAYGVLSRPASRAEFDEYMDRRRGLPAAPPEPESSADRALVERFAMEAERAHREGRPSDAERYVSRLRSLTIDAGDRERVERVCTLIMNSLADEYEKQARYEERHQKWSDAAKSWLRVGEGRPHAPEPLRHAALALLAAENDARRAIELAKRAVALAPDDPHGRRVLGHAYLAAGMKRDARDELETAVRLAHARPGS
jgi:tetratricopeptide (TPR) repeat protein